MNEPTLIKPGKFISLEVARFAAAFCVATDHIVSFTGSLAGGPVLGGFDLPPITSVLFFFVLSGFVIFTAHRGDFGRLNRIPRYLWRRLWRIYPVYWLSLAIPLYFLWSTCSPAYLVQIFTLTPLGGNITEIVPPAWSLRFEIAFYFMFGLALLPYIGRFILAAWIFLVAWEWFPRLLPMAYMHMSLHLPASIAWHFFGTHEIMFFFGLAAGFVFVRLQPSRRLLWPLLAAGGIALVLLARLDAGGFAYPTVERTPLVAGSFAIMIFALAALERGGHLRIDQRWGALGAMSYPFYLFHPSIIFLGSIFFYYHPADRHLASPPTVFIIVMVASLALSALVTFLFDRPLQRFARRIDVARGAGGAAAR